MTVTVFGDKVSNGQYVRDWTSGKTGVVVNEGWSWQDIEWTDGTMESNVPNWRLEEKQCFLMNGGV
jgi:hypothetical protein